ncbi:MAG: hypothetical protein NTW96_27580 [Planctomycetia bacterium]|nr:hypothetical protein [Planctomycetia bacterium]
MRWLVAVLVVLTLTAVCPAQVGLIPGDLNYDGQVSLLDYNIVKLWFGYTRNDPTPVPQTTPEPCTMAVLGVGGLVVLRKRR